MPLSYSEFCLYVTRASKGQPGALKSFSCLGTSDSDLDAVFPYQALSEPAGRCWQRRPRHNQCAEPWVWIKRPAGVLDAGPGRPALACPPGTSTGGSRLPLLGRVCALPWVSSQLVSGLVSKAKVSREAWRCNDAFTTVFPRE